MLALRLDPAIEARLAAMAAKTGRTKTFYARQAIETHLEDLEDYYLAEARVREAEPGTAVAIETLVAKYGIDE